MKRRGGLSFAHHIPHSRSLRNHPSVDRGRTLCYHPVHESLFRERWKECAAGKRALGVIQRDVVLPIEPGGLLDLLEHLNQHFYQGQRRESMKKIGVALLTLAVSISLVALPACTTINPYTEEKQTSKAAKGATIGGIAGAILGAATASRGDRTKMALIGAGIGAIAGGGAGYYMDVQEAKLRQKLEGTGVRVVRDGNDIDLVMPGDVTFETNSASLNSNFFDVLDSVALVLDEYKSTLVTVAGYTDSTGSADYNQKLSEKRASTVALYLHSRGVAQERLAAIGHGEARPVASNSTAEGRARNRRVEITLDPITK
jgi:outer membrane protein OmpA-like peptidoglycan-associated protein